MHHKVFIITGLIFTSAAFPNIHNSPQSMLYSTHDNDTIVIDRIHAAAMPSEIDYSNNNVHISNLQKTNFLEWLFNLTGWQMGKPPPPPSTTPPPRQCDLDCECGKTNLRYRIVGGEVTKENQYPWMAMLLYGTRFYCGATLISDYYLVSAAHCVHGFNMNNINVRLLEHDTAITTETNTLMRKVQKIIKHQNYNSYNYNNDIALVKMDYPVAFDGILRPVCLPTVGKSFTGYSGIVTGWGATQEGGSISTKLLEVSVPIMSNKQCKTSGYSAARITDNMLCAGEPKGGKDSCQGDSGGPLHVIDETTQAHQIVGVVSWGEGCAKENYPGVYSRVNRYDVWIRSNADDGCFCNNYKKSF